jgi:hypothetical protein
VTRSESDQQSAAREAAITYEPAVDEAATRASQAKNQPPIHLNPRTTFLMRRREEVGPRDLQGDQSGISRSEPAGVEVEGA